MPDEDRIAELETQIAELRQMVNELQAGRGAGTSHVFGRNPLVEKYASLGSQVFATLKAGQVFDDTLGKFFPIVVNKTGGIVLNSSANHLNAITFHNSGTSATDLLLSTYGSSGNLILVPNSTSSVAATFTFVDRTEPVHYRGMQFGNGANNFILWTTDADLGFNVLLSSTGQLKTKASTTTESGFTLPHGSAPSSPVNGDIWTTTAGLFVRINGSTVGPLS